MKSKIVIVMPAFNAVATLEKTVWAIPQGFADKIILVDDSSRDDTVRIARRLEDRKKIGFDGHCS